MPIPSLEPVEIFVLAALVAASMIGVVTMLDSRSQIRTVLASLLVLLSFGGSAYMLGSKDHPTSDDGSTSSSRSESNFRTP